MSGASKEEKEETMNKIDVVIERVHEDARLPTYAHGYEEDAGCDLYAIEDKSIANGQTVVIGTGLKMSLPPGVQAEVRSKSGLAAKGVSVVNSPGTVDPSYRGEVKVILNYVDTPCLDPNMQKCYGVRKGDKIAQIVFTSYLGANFSEGKVVNDTQRGEGGGGSTGK